MTTHPSRNTRPKRESVARIIWDCGIGDRQGCNGGILRIAGALGLSKWAVQKMVQRGRIDLNHGPALVKLSRGAVTLDRIVAVNRMADEREAPGTKPRRGKRGTESRRAAAAE